MASAVLGTAMPPPETRRLSFKTRQAHHVGGLEPPVAFSVADLTDVEHVVIGLQPKGITGSERDGHVVKTVEWDLRLAR
jgi:hypothetical protein